jgi:Ca2+-binding EF-hand superfamily protein
MAKILLVLIILLVGPHFAWAALQDQLSDNDVNTEVEQKFDYNGDGQISATERRALIRSLPRRVKRSQEVSYDRNHDGRLNKKEATKMLEETGIFN